MEFKEFTGEERRKLLWKMMEKAKKFIIACLNVGNQGRLVVTADDLCLYINASGNTQFTLNSFLFFSPSAYIHYSFNHSFIHSFVQSFIHLVLLASLSYPLFLSPFPFLSVCLSVCLLSVYLSLSVSVSLSLSVSVY